MKNLVNASSATRTATGTTNVVTSGTNTLGIIIHHAHVMFQGTNTQCKILIGGVPVIGGVSSASNVPFAAETSQTMLFPAGVALDITIANGGSNAHATVWYEVLT